MLKRYLAGKQNRLISQFLNTRFCKHLNSKNKKEQILKRKYKSTERLVCFTT